MSTSSTLLSPPQTRRTLEPITSLWQGKLAPSWFEWVFVITGGLIVGLPLVWLVGESALGRSDQVRWFFWISTLVSSPHVYSTYVRFQRKSNEGKMSGLVGVPTYVALVGVLATASWLGLFVEAMTFVNVWQSH